MKFLTTSDHTLKIKSSYRPFGLYESDYSLINYLLVLLFQPFVKAF